MSVLETIRLIIVPSLWQLWASPLYPSLSRRRSSDTTDPLTDVVGDRLNFEPKKSGNFGKKSKVWSWLPLQKGPRLDHRKMNLNRNIFSGIKFFWQLIRTQSQVLLQTCWKMIEKEPLPLKSRSYQAILRNKLLRLNRKKVISLFQVRYSLLRSMRTSEHGPLQSQISRRSIVTIWVRKKINDHHRSMKPLSW